MKTLALAALLAITATVGILAPPEKTVYAAVQDDKDQQNPQDEEDESGK